MVATVSHSLFERLLDTFPTDRSYSRADLKRSAMPGSVSDYIAAAMDVRLEDHLLPDLSTDAWVDPRNPTLLKAHQAYAAMLAEQQRIPVQEWKGILSEACENVVRFLVYPGATLADTVFGNGTGAAEADRVMSALRFYTSYPYFQEVVRAYFAQKGVTRVHRDRLETLVARIDRQMTADYKADEWMKLLRPLLDVLEAAGYEEEVPYQILKATFHEKGADRQLQRLEELGEDFVRIDQLRDVLSDTGRPAKPERPVARPVAQAAPALEEDNDPIPLWKQFERGAHVSIGESVSRAPIPSSSPEPLWRQFRAEGAPLQADIASAQPAPHANSRVSAPPSPMPGRSASPTEIEQSVLGPRGARNRDLFVKHLFGGDSRDYEATLRSLYDARDWSQASQIIAREVFQKNQVNIYSDPAVAFTDAVESRFRR